jgi:hypothetical protein
MLCYGGELHALLQGESFTLCCRGRASRSAAVESFMLCCGGELHALLKGESVTLCCGTDV